MPVYDFRCQECDQVSEVFFRSADGQAVHCPNCGSKNMEKLVSASYMIKMDTSPSGTTCCGRTDRCEKPPCSTGDTCRRR